MIITLTKSDFTKKNPIAYRIAQETDILENLIRITPLVIVFYGYGRETVYNHFMDSTLTRMVRRGILKGECPPQEHTFRLFETDLIGCFFDSIYWYYNKEWLNDETTEGSETLL